MKFDRLSLKQIRLSLILLAAAVISYSTQVQFNAWQWYSEPKINIQYNVFIEPQPLSAATARAASFGAREFMADWYWLKLIQYYGGGDPQGKYRKLAELFNTVTDLSPKFLTPYQVGLLTLPGEGFVDEALQLGLKGQQNLPESWELPYYTGLVYHQYRKDFVSAARQFELAASRPGAPANTKLFAAIYYKEADQKQISYQIFKTIADSSQDSFVRERALKYLGHLDGIFLLETAIKNFRQQFDRLPISLKELIDKQIINEIPVSPLGFSYTYDSSAGTINDAK